MMHTILYYKNNRIFNYSKEIKAIAKTIEKKYLMVLPELQNLLAVSSVLSPV